MLTDKAKTNIVEVINEAKASIVIGNMGGHSRLFLDGNGEDIYEAIASAIQADAGFCRIVTDAVVEMMKSEGRAIAIDMPSKLTDPKDIN